MKIKYLSSGLSEDEIIQAKHRFRSWILESNADLIVIHPEESVFFPLLYWETFNSSKSLMVCNENQIDSSVKKILMKSFGCIHIVKGTEKIEINEQLNSDEVIEEIANSEIMLTSGSTGTPKLVLWKKEKLLTHVDRINRQFNLTNEVPELIVMPLTHSFGLMRMRCALRRDAHIYKAKGVNDFKTINYAFQSNSSLAFGAVASGMEMLLTQISRFDSKKLPTSLRIETGSMCVSKNLLEDLIRLRERVELDYFHHYGSTEFTRRLFVSLDDLIKENGLIGRNNKELEIKDSVLHIFNSQGFEGYLGPDGLVSHTDKWFNTGDVVKLLDNGDLVFQGRTGERLNVNGIKHLASQIEARIHRDIGHEVVVFPHDDSTVMILTTSTVLGKSLNLWCLRNLQCIPKIQTVPKILRTRSGKLVRNKSNYDIS